MRTPFRNFFFFTDYFRSHYPKYSPSLVNNFNSLSLAIFLSSGLPSSCSSIAEFSSACSCSGSNSKALSKYANACEAFPCSKKTTPNWNEKVCLFYMFAQWVLYINSISILQHNYVWFSIITFSFHKVKVKQNLLLIFHIKHFFE